MSFAGRTREEEQRMLREIGVERFEELLGEEARRLSDRFADHLVGLWERGAS